MRAGSSVAVVGAGLGGLAAACVSAARGHKVTLYDKNDWLGGKAAVLHEGGFRFDMGPTILTVPKVLERIFQEAGRDIHDYLDLRRLDPQWRCFFDDNTHLDLMADVPTMAADMERFAPGTGAGEGYKKFLEISEHLHDVSNKFFFWKPVEDLFDTINIRANMNPGTLRDVLSLRMGSSVAGTIRSKVKDARLAQMLDHFVQYVGSSPYGAPAVLCAIAHMQTAEGVWYPMGGTRAVAEALAKLAGELGATLRPGDEVTGLAIEKGAVKGVRTASGVTPFDAVISNMDSVRTYRELVGGDVGKAYEKKSFEPACSGVVLYLGLNKRYEHLNHHDFVFSRDPEEEFDYIYRKGEPAPDPTAYLAAPSSTDPSVAPEGGEALYVLVHTPVPAAAPRLVEDVPGLPAGHPRQAQAHGRHARPRGAHRRRAPPHAAGHPRALQGAQRRDLRPGLPRQVHGRVQAGQPLAAGARPLPRRRRRPSGSRHADGDDVGLDRGGRPRHRCARAPVRREARASA